MRYDRYLLFGLVSLSVILFGLGTTLIVRQFEAGDLRGTLPVDLNASLVVMTQRDATHRIKVLRAAPPKLPKQVTSDAQYTPGSFPACYRSVGWYYGWHRSGFEYGTDFDCSYHTAIRTLWGGTVVWSGRTWWGSGTAGGLVVIEAFVPGLGFTSAYYLHLDWNYVSVGQKVARGQVVGLSGGQVGYGHWPTSPQFTGGPHLEMGFCYPYEPFPVGHNVNPLYFIDQALA